MLVVTTQDEGGAIVFGSAVVGTASGCTWLVSVRDVSHLSLQASVKVLAQLV